MSNEPEVEVIEEGVGLELLNGADALTAVDRASIDMQISTAKEYPRSITKSLNEAATLATLDPDTAASCFYSLPRAGKKIEGPSVRLAEIMAYSWGNLRADADIVAEDATHVTAMGTCFDLEKNVAVRVRVKRRITNKHGKRFDADMIGVTSNAAISIALRNAIFKVVPAAFVKRVYGDARKASLGEGTMQEKRQRAWEFFEKRGLKVEQVYEALGVAGWDDIGTDEIIMLRGMATALRDGETTIEQMFYPSKHSEKTDELNHAIANGAQESTDDGKEGATGEGAEMSDGPDSPTPTQDDESTSTPGARDARTALREKFEKQCKAIKGVKLDLAYEVLLDIAGVSDKRGLTAEHYQDVVEDMASFITFYEDRKAQQAESEPAAVTAEQINFDG